jgi:ribosomal protein S18 acetylase RimI-like enzyme
VTRRRIEGSSRGLDTDGPWREVPRIRLEPMNEAEFQVSLQRAIPRHADLQVRLGLWKASDALAASRAEFAQLLPKGRGTPDYEFRHIFDANAESRVGEAWTVVRNRGGKVQFWVDWIWVEPSARRRGVATAVFRILEQEASGSGADRVGLNVRYENAEALALYTKLGYRPTHLRMSKVLGPPTADER